MSTIVTRSGKGAALTHVEVDANFTNLNTDKADKASPTFTGTVTLPNSLLQVTASSYPQVRPSLNLDFANTKQLDPRITFVRNSTAAYYDGQTTAMAEQNLLQYSQTFASPWTVIDVTRPASTIAAPDGTTTGILLTEGTGLTYHALAVNGGVGVLPIGTSTYSVYGKANGRYLILAGSNGASIWVSAVFDLTAGTVNSSVNGGQTIVSTSCTQVGTTGWYRCVVTFTSTTVLGFNIATSNVSTAASGSSFGLASYTGDGTSGFYLWGAQLEQRSSATAYTPTTTTAITNYIPVLMTAPAGVARFDCDPITRNSLGLLIEESRTNLLTYSSDFSNAAWFKFSVNLTVNTIVAPDGTLTAAKLIATTANSPHAVSPAVVTLVTGTTYTRTMYLKNAGYNFVLLNTVAIGNSGPFIDLTSGTVVGSYGGGSYSTSITDAGNGWWRIAITFTATSTITTSPDVYTGICLTASTTSFAGNGYSGIYIWGAQLEAGSFATSYIPTVASTVTRAADNASMTGTNFSSWYNQAQGTVYVDSDTFASGTSAKGVLEFSNTTVNNQTIRISYLNGGNASYCTATLPTDVGTFRPQAPPNKPYKITLSYSSGNIATFSINGINTVASSGSAGAITAPIDVLVIGKLYYSGALLCGHIRKLSYYPIALSSSSLVALTS